jgi:hypothetical protein
VPVPQEWSPEHEAVVREDVPGTDRALDLLHPTYPFEGTLADDGSDALIGFAATYLRTVSRTLGLNQALGNVPELFQDPDHPREFLDTVPLAWLELAPDDPAGAAPQTRSFWVSRAGDAAPFERTAVILAVQSVKANRPDWTLGSRLGIQIVAHVSTDAPSVTARITGSSCSAGLAGALALPVPLPSANALIGFLQEFYEIETKRLAVKAQIRAAVGFGDPESTFYDGLRIVEASASHAVIEAYLTMLPESDQPEAPAHALAARLLVDGKVTTVTDVRKWPLVAHAGPARLRLFTQDPASRAGIGKLIDSRPNRSPQRLRRYRARRTLTGVMLGTASDVSLLDDLNQVEVMQSKLVDPAADETAQQDVVPGRIVHPRLNSFAAVSAYQHLRGLVQLSSALAPRGLLDTLRAYGLSAVQYFRFATLPVHVRYRAPIDHGGKDGRVVNAQVNFEGQDGDLVATTTPGTPRPLQMKFGLADLRRSVSRREPLGIAADPRWCWHECSHVLLAASTGAAQFRFAHSAGDALAAVLSDPDSALATHPRLRGLTFPWVYIHRRHDRDVFVGWSWSGRYHRPSRFTTDVNSYPRKGYESEQILSTSLFRLYRALGGDTTLATGQPDVAARRRAADYTAYLIMKAIRLMPPAFLVPLETPNQLVSTLTKADVGTLPAPSGPLRGRVGGWAHKVIRWAFEAQGLYATTDPDEIVNAPGKPRDRDVFIDDGRDDSPGGFPRGGYMPVSLDWQPVASPPGPPRWHAAAPAIQVAGDTVSVEVSNRGPSPAPQVRVAVWWAEWSTTQPDPPAWNDGAWHSLGTSVPQTVAPWPARTAFGPFSAAGIDALPTLPAGRRLLIVASATSPSDRANTDPFSLLPCALLPTPIVDLVAGDNNIGLRLHVT